MVHRRCSRTEHGIGEREQQIAQFKLSPRSSLLQSVLIILTDLLQDRYHGIILSSVLICTIAIVEAMGKILTGVLTIIFSRITSSHLLHLLFLTKVGAAMTALLHRTRRGGLLCWFYSAIDGSKHLSFNKKPAVQMVMRNAI